MVVRWLLTRVMPVLVDAFYNAPDSFWTVLQCLRKRPPKLRPGFLEPVGPDKLQEVEISLPGAGSKTVSAQLTWNLTSQHTLSWSKPISAYIDGACVSLKPGSCNLYTFPRVVWEKPRVQKKASMFAVVRGAEAAAAKPFEVLEGSLLELLRMLFLAIARHPVDRDLLRLPDWSGANSVLGLLVANTEVAVTLCCDIFEVWPELMAQAHLRGESGGLFMGENLFHCLAVNSQVRAPAVPRLARRDTIARSVGHWRWRRLASPTDRAWVMRLAPAARHARHRASCSPWHPRAMAVLCVPLQEAALCRLIQLAYDRLDREMLRECFTSQAVGPFFWVKPMNTYGGTPMAYAAAFCMRKAIALWLQLARHDKMRGFVGLNGEYAEHCKLTGARRPPHRQPLAALHAAPDR